MTREIAKAGIVSQSICPTCSNNSQSAMAAAILVVSDKGDNLSPKNAPEIIAAAVRGVAKPIAFPTAIKAIPTVAIEVKDVPKVVETIAVIKAAKGTNKPGLKNLSP